MRIQSRLAWLRIIPLCAMAAVTGLIWLALAAMYDPDAIDVTAGYPNA